MAGLGIEQFYQNSNYHHTLEQNLGQITTGNNGWGLVVDTTLESSGRPVNELDGSLGLDSGNCGVDILGDDISSRKKVSTAVEIKKKLPPYCTQ